MGAKNTFRTVPSLQAIKAPKAGRVEYWDADTKGLGLRVSPSGRKTWILMYRVRGEKRVRRATLGTYPTLSLADAREMAQGDLRAAAKGKDPAATRKGERAADTFGELAERYIERYAKKKKRSWRKDRQTLDRDLLPRFKHRKAAGIKRREVIEMLEEIADRGAPVGANRTLEIMRKIYNWGIEREVVEVNPCQRIKKIGVERQRERVLTDDEIRAIWGALADETPAMCAMFKMRFLTAQRGSEVSRMRWQDIDRQGGWWTISGAFTKNGRDHRVPLNPAALDLLRSLEKHSQGQEWVFPSPTGKGPLRVIWRAMNDIRKASSVTEFKSHDIRRTVATRMTGDLGISRQTVGRVLNHIEANVTGIYDRYSYDREKRAALDAWGDRLAEVLAGRTKAENVVNLATAKKETESQRPAK